MIPRGISEGLNIRTPLSQTNIRIAPINILPGREYWVSEPNNLRERWGTINPIHPIIPLNEVVAETANTAAVINSICSICIRTPKEVATSESNAKRLIRHRYFHRMKRQTHVMTITKGSPCHIVKPKLPISQNSIACS